MLRHCAKHSQSSRFFCAICTVKLPSWSPKNASLSPFFSLQVIPSGAMYFQENRPGKKEAWEDWTQVGQQNKKLSLVPGWWPKGWVGARGVFPLTWTLLDAMPRGQIEISKMQNPGTSLAVQWLRCPVPNAGGAGSIPARDLRSHMWCGQNKLKKKFQKITDLRSPYKYKNNFNKYMNKMWNLEQIPMCLSTSCLQPWSKAGVTNLGLTQSLGSC